MVRESSIETYLVKQVRARAGMCIKLSPLGQVGIPDRLLLLPGGVVVFVECKKPRGSRVARLQIHWCGRLRAMGFRSVFVYTREEVDQMMEDLV